MSFKDRYNKLNPAQQEAVDTIDGPVLVLAGPGSGKTELLSVRVANILDKTDTEARDILCLTFTEAASTNMRERLATLIGTDAYRVPIHTFHGLASEIITEYSEYFWDGATMRPIDELTQIALLEQIFDGLGHSNLLYKIHPEEGYIYLSDVRGVIGWLKQAGITPDDLAQILKHNEQEIQELNPEIDVLFGGRLSKKDIDTVAGWINGHDSNEVLWTHSIKREIISSLSQAVTEAQEADSTKPLSAWKTKYTAKDGDSRVLKDAARIDKWLHLQELYATYQHLLYTERYFDFGDMVLSVVAACKKYPQLLSELQEKYHYVMVDEFQDTNGAQLQLVQLLGAAEVNEDRPNIMVVGDDDQAIYRFQGAESSHMIDFLERYREVSVITMTENYRSRQGVLDGSQKIIEGARGRVAEKLPSIDKTLVASHPDRQDDQGLFEVRSFASPEAEYTWIAELINGWVIDGVNPESIAIVARKHSSLRAQAQYLQSIPHYYAAGENVLEQPIVKELIVFAQTIVAISQHDHNKADMFLSELLSFPWWGIDQVTRWKISREVYASRNSTDWLTIMLGHEDEEVIRVARLLQVISEKTVDLPVDQVLDILIGTVAVEGGDSMELHSPFRTYYFSSEERDIEPGSYYSFLAQLKTFVRALREHNEGKKSHLKDLLVFVELCQKNNVRLGTAPLLSTGVQLMSIHASKGLEFEKVIVLDTNETHWKTGSRGNKLSLLTSLQSIQPAGNDEGDLLRLLFVAMTRSEKDIICAYPSTDHTGKVSGLSRYLENLGIEALETEVELVEDAMALPQVVPNSFVESEKELLKNALSSYQMSVTHLNNYLDVENGGPKKFLENNLLRFPQAKTVPLIFGTAVDDTFSWIYKQISLQGVVPGLEKTKEYFEKELRRGHLSEVDYGRQFERGGSILEAYYNQVIDRFDNAHKIQVPFKGEGVFVGDAHLTGNLDKLVVDEENKTVSVYDFKTGKVFGSWKGKTSYEKNRLAQYRRQLLFYKVLLENSATYATYEVKTLALEFLEADYGRFNGILELDYSDEEYRELKQLIEKVWQRIHELDFVVREEISTDDFVKTLIS